MLKTKYLWLIHLAVCVVASGICIALAGQLFFAIALAVQWIEATFAVGIVLSILSFVPGRPLSRALPQTSVWVVSLALSGLLAYWVEVALDPLLNIGSASFGWSFYLWCAPLLGLYLVGTAVHRLRLWRRDRRSVEGRPTAQEPLESR